MQRSCNKLLTSPVTTHHEQDTLLLQKKKKEKRNLCLPLQVSHCHTKKIKNYSFFSFLYFGSEAALVHTGKSRHSPGENSVSEEECRGLIAQAIQSLTINSYVVHCF